MVTESDVRRLALALPATTEKPSYGTPGFRVGDRLFARILEDPAHLVLWVEDEHEKLAMIDAEPTKFSTTPHYDGHPMVLVRLDAVDDEELSELLAGSWDARVPPATRRRLDRERTG